MFSVSYKQIDYDKYYSSFIYPFLDDLVRDIKVFLASRVGSIYLNSLSFESSPVKDEYGSLNVDLHVDMPNKYVSDLLVSNIAKLLRPYRRYHIIHTYFLDPFNNRITITFKTSVS